jgi:hypothetical protein
MSLYTRAFREARRMWVIAPVMATAQILRKPTASGPFLPSITSTATRRPSARPTIPARPSAEACTKVSLPPRSEYLQHFSCETASGRDPLPIPDRHLI